MKALQRSEARLIEAIGRAERAKHGDRLRARFLLQEARTAHLIQELKQEKRESKK